MSFGGIYGALKRFSISCYMVSNLVQVHRGSRALVPLQPRSASPTYLPRWLKKKELESLAKSTENVFRAVEESVIREIGNVVQPSCESELDNQTSKHSDERAKIIISIQDKDGIKQIRIFMDEKFERLFKMYSDKHKMEQQKLVFSFDGERLSPGDAAIGLGMVDNDIVEVHVKPS